MKLHERVLVPGAC